jgi:hypothetical protein
MSGNESIPGPSGPDDFRNIRSGLGQVIVYLQRSNSIDGEQRAQMRADLSAGLQHIATRKVERSMLEKLLAKP